MQADMKEGFKEEEPEKERGAFWLLPGAVGVFVLAVALFYAVMGENSHIAIHDNLDLFTPQYRMLRQTGTFFSQHAVIPFLGGIDRDYLPTELSLVSLCYMLLPPLAAYVACYLAKVLIATGSGYALLKALHEGQWFASLRAWRNVRGTALILSFTYGLLNLFPQFGIAFASLPLVSLLFLKLYRLSPDAGVMLSMRRGTEMREAFSKAGPYYAGLFFYPFVSYFSYFGIFILGYALLWILVLAVGSLRTLHRLKHPEKEFRHRTGTAPAKSVLPLCTGWLLLAAGYVLFEYRLFRLMLLSDTVSIRETMAQSSLSLPEALGQSADVLLHGMMHTEDVHDVLVLFAVAVFLIAANAGHIAHRRYAQILRDPLNFCALMLICNSLVYGLYDFAPVRNCFEALIPPLKGFQFNRTVFFNPLLWYGAFYLICTRMKKTAGMMLASFACLIVLFVPVRYNDLYYTAHAAYYRLRHDGKSPDAMSYGDFFMPGLFADIKEELNYPYEKELTHPAGGTGSGSSTEVPYAVSFGIYPAVLEYNGIATLDGYLGYYPQAYKEAFRTVIAPALDRVPASKAYFDDWGARCYLFSGTRDALPMGTRSFGGITEETLYLDTEALAAMHCEYLFSRVKVRNAGALSLTLLGTFSPEHDGAYTIYVYQLS